MYVYADIWPMGECLWAKRLQTLQCVRPRAVARGHKTHNNVCGILAHGCSPNARGRKVHKHCKSAMSFGHGLQTHTSVRGLLAHRRTPVGFKTTNT